MPRPRPRSPLFPYTTLFRSRARFLFVVMNQGFETWTRVLATLSEEEREALTEIGIDDWYPLSDASTRDRKSTRLNSSHRCISYAVFCLKKQQRAVAGSEDVP